MKTIRLEYIQNKLEHSEEIPNIVDAGKYFTINRARQYGKTTTIDAEKQISEYFEYFGLSTGYMLSFNFNKKKETGVKQVHVGGKVLYEGVV